jgi:hypothetical protein
VSSAAGHPPRLRGVLRSDPVALTTYRRLEIASFTHSVVYLSLLVCAFALGGPQPETFVLGLTHGVVWIVMSLLCIAAATRKIVPFWLAVLVAVIGGLGPFAGSIGFILVDRRRAAPSPAATLE